MDEHVEADMIRVIKLGRQLLKELPIEICEGVAAEFELALDDLDSWFEDNDPRSMGWVGDNGLP